jgi:hypothetical protein
MPKLKKYLHTKCWNPALLYQISKEEKVKLVYQENHEKVFFDSMQFWNNKEGIAMGDPIADCLNVIITRDGEIHGVKYLQINYQK